MTGYGGSNDHFGCDSEMSYELVGALSNNCDSSTGGRTFRIKYRIFRTGKTSGNEKFTECIILSIPQHIKLKRKST